LPISCSGKWEAILGLLISELFIAATNTFVAYPLLGANIIQIRVTSPTGVDRFCYKRYYKHAW